MHFPPLQIPSWQVIVTGVNTVLPNEATHRAVNCLYLAVW